MFPVVVPVAGLGTRSLPVSKVVAKELIPILNKPLIHYIVEEAVESGAEEVVFVTSAGKAGIEDYFDIDPGLEATLAKRGKEDFLNEIQEISRMIEVKAVRQKEPLGLGHAVGMARSLIRSSHFFVMLGDELTVSKPRALDQLLSVYQQKKSSIEDCGVIMLMEVSRQDTQKYGICELDGDRVVGCVEKPKPEEAPSTWAITGRYLLPQKTLDDLKNQGSGALGEIQLTDSLNRLAQEGKLFACQFQGKRLDAGDPIGFLEATLHYYLESKHASAAQEVIQRYSK